MAGHPYHQPWAPPPAPVALQPAPIAVDSSLRPPGDELRTIFITGLPEDVKERELYNLLRFLPGFEASQINFKGEQPMGFALFSTAHYAMEAKNHLDDLVYDGETKSVIRTDMAKKNLYVKRGVGTESNALDQSKRLRTGGDYTHTGYPSPAPFHPPSAAVWGPHGYMPPPPYDPYGGYSVAPLALPPPPSYVHVQNTKDNPPCNTLFIGHLSENTVEEELTNLFSCQAGYKQMKILRRDKNTVCFIEFDDVAAASAVHRTLQGAVIPSSPFGGMRIQFSKNPFGRRKDTNGVANSFNGAGSCN